MERIKHCPNCGTDNAASNLFCERCGTDISRVSVEFVSNESENDLLESSDIMMSDSKNEQSPSGNLEYIKICRYCGKVSNLNSSLCLGCGTELTSGDICSTEGKITADYIDMINKSGTSKYNITVVGEAGQIKSHTLFNGLSVFGRKCVDYTENKPNYCQCISDIHCLILADETAAEIIDVSLNGTFLNDQRIIGRTTINDGMTVEICDKKCLSLVFRRFDV